MSSVSYLLKVNSNICHGWTLVSVVVALFVIECNYSRLIPHEMLKKPVTYIVTYNLHFLLFCLDLLCVTSEIK